jgi:hypothetical protein
VLVIWEVTANICRDESDDFCEETMVVDICVIKLHMSIETIITQHIGVVVSPFLACLVLLRGASLQSCLGFVEQSLGGGAGWKWKSSRSRLIRETISGGHRYRHRMKGCGGSTRTNGWSVQSSEVTA